MAKRKNPNESLDTIVTATSVTFRAKHRSKADPSQWEIVDTYVVECAAVAELLENGDQDPASMKAYGIRAFLCDRASDFRAHGVHAYLEAIKDGYAKTLAVGVYKAKRESKARQAGLDPLLVQAVADLKQLPVEAAIASLKALTPDQLAGVKANPKIVEAIQAAKLASLEAEAVDLGDLY